MSKHVFTQADPDDISTPSAGQVALFNNATTGRFNRRTEGGDLVDIEGDGIAKWRRYGTVLEPTDGEELGGIQEISVLYEESPQVLADTGQSVFKAWYTGGFGGNRGLCYAESQDGLTWTRHKTGGEADYVLDDLIHASVIKEGGTYYAFGADSGSLTLDVYSSADGITWSLVVSDAVPRPGTGWNATYYGNIFAWKEGATWYILAEALGDVTDVSWSIGLFTTTNLAGTWTAAASNPVLTRAEGTIGGPFVTKVSGRYWMWAHGNDGTADTTFPSDIYRYWSDDLLTWTQSPDRPVLRRSQLDGSDSPYGQAADPWLVEANGKTYMFYEGGAHGGNTTTLFRGKVAIADHTISELVMLAEDADGFEPPRFGQTGNPTRLRAIIASATAITAGNFPNLTFTDSFCKGSNGVTLAENGFDAGKTTWTVPRSGWYRIRLSVYLSVVSATGTQVIIGFISGGGYLGGGFTSHYVRNSADTPTFACETMDFFDAGTEITFRVYPVGGNVTVSNDGVGTYLSIEELPVV